MSMNIEKKTERFNQKYRDKGGHAKFLEMVENLATLDQLGKHFGFSRQNAAGLFKSFFNKGYGDVHKKRRIKRQIDQLSSSCDLDDIQNKLGERGKERSAKKVGYVKLVRKIAESRGYTMLIRRKRSGALEVYVNGYKCTISGSETQTIYHIPQGFPPSIYYRYAIPSKRNDFCIFVLELKDHYTFYVIPFDLIKHLTLITLKDNYERQKGRRGNTSSKYAIYRNNWDLLKEPNPAPEYEKELREIEAQEKQ